MVDTPIYQYELTGRRPVTILGLVVGLGMVAAGFTYRAEWYFLAPVCFAVLLMLVQLVPNPVSGSEITEEVVRFYSGKTAESVEFSNIRAMRVTQWSDGGPDVTLILHDGAPVRFWSLCIDGGFITTLKKLGIPEVNS